MIYILSKEGYMEIASYEAVSTMKYLDTSGVQTIGLGSTKSDIPGLGQFAWNKEITMQQAFDYFETGMKKYVDAVNKAVKVVLNQHQFDALVSIAYNIGCSGEAHSTFLHDINTHVKNNYIAEHIRIWDKSGGMVSKGLLARRNREINLYMNGEYSNNGKILHFPVDQHSHQPIYRLGKYIDANLYIKD